MTLQFQSAKTRPVPLAVRHWYHIPRKGDQVDIPGVAGYVAHVCWSDEKVVVVMDR